MERDPKTKKIGPTNDIGKRQTMTKKSLANVYIYFNSQFYQTLVIL